MLKIRFTVDLGRPTRYAAGDEAELEDDEALGWVAMGYAELVEPPKAPAPKPKA